MTITTIIAENWDDLSERAQNHIRKTRPYLLRQWDISEHGYTFASVTADTLEEALAAAREKVESGDSGYDLSEGTVYADYYVTNAVTGECDSFSVTWEAQEPACEDDEHDWQSPYELLGGIKENPGVWSHGGGVIIRECCARCGRYRITDTWAQRPDTGEQGLREVRYEDADEASLAWVELLIAQKQLDDAQVKLSTKLELARRRRR